MYSKFYYLFFCLLLATGFLTSCSDDDSNPTSTTDMTKTEQIDAVADSLIKNIPDLTAIIVGIWDNVNNFSYEKAYGIADTANSTPANTAMLSRVASVTKTFVGTVALKLVDEGKLKLDDKVTDYLSQYSKYSAVTIQMLLQMTSGIRDYSTEADFPLFLLSHYTEKVTPDELIQFVYNRSFLFTPGEFKHGYSSTNTILLGMILEKITGKTLDVLIRETITEPLGLSNSFFATSTAMPSDNVLHGYYTFANLRFDMLTDIDPGWAWAAGAMVSNIYDLKIWLKNLVDGGLISDSLQQKRFEGPLDEYGNIYGVGLGCYGNNLWGHGGKAPGYQTIAVRDRSADRTFVIFFNTMSDTRPHDFLKRILEIIKGN